MNRMIILIAMLLLSAFTSFSQTDAVRLPGEDGRIPALSPYPFPDRLTAYVWRNWGLVDASVLEATIGAPSGRLAKIAMEMGLPRDPEE
ncbi:MAG: hypothetical protein IJV91_08860 [Kiritimatiellae bacterium]|nr:hypothetical protein [Kiritimatiellia bacterium]